MNDLARTVEALLFLSAEPVPVERLAEAIGDLLTIPPPLDLRHVRRPAVSVEQRLAHLRQLLAAGSRFSFDEAVKGGDRLTEAVTLFALLELYKAGEAEWEQDAPFAPITVRAHA